MDTLPAAIASRNWDACILALVAAFEKLPPIRAHQVAWEITATLEAGIRHMESHREFWVPFMERADESLQTAFEYMAGRDFVIWLSSAVTDMMVAFWMTNGTFNGHGFPDRDEWRERNIGEAWGKVHRIVVGQPEFEGTDIVDIYRPGALHGRALWAIEACILSV